MAASNQGKFWEYHDVLFSNQKALKKTQLVGYAKDLGLDLKKFKADLRDATVHLKVDNDTKACATVGGPRKMGGTPAFYINGKTLSGAQPFAEFQKVIADQLRRAKKLEESGTARKDIARLLTEREKDGTDIARYFFDEIALMEAGAGLKPYKVPLDAKRNGSRGSNEALLTLVSFVDYSDAKSAESEATLATLEAAYPGKIRVVTKAFVKPGDDAASLAAEAARAAHAQGKFQGMHAQLLANAGALTRANLDAYAASIGLDAAVFAAALDKRTYKADILRDARDAAGLEVATLPVTFINGQKVEGGDLDDLKWTAEDELRKANKLVESGTKAADVYKKTVKGGTYLTPVAGPSNTFDLSGASSLGSSAAPITIVEFSDFQCPYCGRVGGPLKALVKKYPNQVRVVFKHFPLSFHKQAKMCAEATLAAGAQGKFWEMHDKLFDFLGDRTAQTAIKADKQTAYNAKLQEFAQAIGLDMTRFNADLKGGKFRAQVEKDMAEGSRSGVRGTPSLFINGRKLDTKVAPPEGLEPFLVADFGLQPN